MAVTPVSSGQGSTQDPAGSPWSKVVSSAGPNANWYMQVVSSYNKPVMLPSTQPIYQQIVQRKPPEIMGLPLSGPIAGLFQQNDALPGVSAATSGNWMQAEQTAKDAATRQITGGVNPQINDAYAAKGIQGYYSKSRLPDKPGYIVGQTMFRDGSLGFYYSKPPSATSTITIEDQANAQSQPGAPETVDGNLPVVDSSKPNSIYDEIDALESSYESRRYAEAVKLWGEPTTVNGPGGSRLEWTAGMGKEYLGITPGFVPTRTFEAPPEGASLKELQQYRDKLQRSIRTPLYTEDSIFENFESEDTIKRFQRKAAKAGIYTAGTKISFGILSMTDVNLMRNVMAEANLNGLEWEQVLDSYVERQQKGQSLSGGGESGSGGTSVSTQIQYSQTSLAQGRTLLSAVLKDALGREPTESEVADFLKFLNAKESKSPMTTVTTTNKSGKSSKSVSRMTPSGVDASALAEQFAQEIGGGVPFEQNQENYYLDGLLKSLIGG